MIEQNVAREVRRSQSAAHAARQLVPGVVDADDAGEKAGLILMDIICAAGGSGSCGYMATASDEEKFLLTLVVLPRLAKRGEYTARITLQRIVYDKQERIKERGVIGDAETYQRIFDKLSKSIFLETSQL